VAEISAISAEDELVESGCQAIPSFERVSNFFSNVTKNNSDFAIAYHAEGVLWLSLLNYLQIVHEKIAPWS
jgi:hypothetical protein